MARNFKKLTIAMVAVFAFFLCMPTTFALEETDSQQEVAQENTSRWQTLQPERKVTSEGLIIEYDIDVTISYFFEAVANVTITIPEDYELDTIVIAPDVFQEISKAISEYLEDEYTGNFEMSNDLQPGDSMTVNFTINNLSKYTYNYDETSFEIFPTEDIVYKQYTEEVTNPAKDTPLFNGETVNDNYHFNRTYNTALQALIPNSNNAAMTDEAIDSALRENGYVNGFADYTKYLLNFYNNKYETNNTRLDQFPDGIIREILGESDPLYNNTTIFNSIIWSSPANPAIKDEIDEALKEHGYNSVEEYILEYYNKKYNTQATRIVDLSEEALDDLFSMQGVEKGFTYNLETNPDVIALSYDFFYNKNLSFGFEDDTIRDANSEDFSIGEYMRDEAKGDEVILENAGTLTPNSTSTIENTQLKNNGTYTLNAYLGYEFMVDLQWTYSALKGTVIAQYVDIFGNVLTEDVITKDMVGRDYQTYQKEFAGYQLVTIDGEETGKYIDGEIVVVYVYAPTIPEDIPGFETGSTDGWEIEPPKTGIEISTTNDTTLYLMATILVGSLGLLTVTRKSKQQ